ncbi:right-handed parallel beta-helix repeat-containing protein [bacterium]|nr:right-handed parallel beta-helix repeat-containing protein [bacterium]
MRRNIYILCFIILSLSSAHAQTEVSGDVSGVWEESGSPYLVIGNLCVPTDSSLRIMPGCSVIFQSRYGFWVDSNAVLKAIGLENQLITFTAADTHFTDTSGGHYGIDFYYADSSCSLSYCEIEYGNGYGDENNGGAININSTFLVILNCSIHSNRARNGGGGIFSKDSNPLIKDCYIYDNFAGHGGGLDLRGDSPRLINLHIINNYCYGEGGGINCCYTTARIENCVIARNKSGDSGGMFCGHFSEPIIVNCNIIDNVSASNGGSLGSYWESNPIVFNCVFEGNLAPETNEIAIYTEYLEEYVISSKVTIAYSSVRRRQCHAYGDESRFVWLSDFFHEVPYFADALFHLIPGFSHFIDAGVGELEVPGDTTYYAPSFDIDGDSRPFGESWDMGVDEYVPGFEYCGEVYGDWRLEDGPYFVTCDIHVPPESTLIIHPEVTVNFMGNYKLTVDSNAVLKAIGNVFDSITFISPDTHLTDSSGGHRGIQFHRAAEGCTLKYCKIQYGNAIGEDIESNGGGIGCYGSNPVITRCTIKECSANNKGGGIYCTSRSSPVIFRNSIYLNSSYGGAGICVDDLSSPIINFNTIRENTADIGAGIHVIGSNPTINANYVYSNQADSGGAFAIENSSRVELYNNVIFNNNANYNGGAISVCNNSALNLINNTFSLNSSEYGGAIFAEQNSEIIVLNSIFYNDSASLGEEIYILSHFVEPCTIFVGYSVIDSSKCHWNSDINLILWEEGNINCDPLFLDSIYHISFDSPCKNAGTKYIYFSPWDTILYSPVIDIDSSYRYLEEIWDIGADEFLSFFCGEVFGRWTKDSTPYYIYCNVYIPQESTLIIEPGVDIIFLGNYQISIEPNALLKAIGIENDSIIFTAMDTLFTDSSGGHHGLRFDRAAEGCSLVYCKVEYGNTIGTETEPFGGGIYSYASSPFISSCQITKCNALYGGGIYIRDCKINIENSQFLNNHADSIGGGLFACSSNVYITGNAFSRNNCSEQGGGIACLDNQLITITRNKFENNHSLYGGGLSIVNSAGNFSNNILAKNSAIAGGGIQIIKNSRLTMLNNTITGNVADSIGGAISLRNGVNLSLLNNIFWEDTAGFGQEIHVGFTDSADSMIQCSIYFSYCDIDSAGVGGEEHASFVYWNSGNIYYNPLFEIPTYQLSSISPCIDSGRGYTFNLWSDSIYAPFVDIRNYPRPFGPGWDMGAFEFGIDTVEFTCGNISGVWRVSESPYYISCDVHIPPDSTLVIEPGCKIIFLGNYKFCVDRNATLIAIGSEADSIIFTALDTFLTDSSGGHHGIRCEYVEICTLSYCRIEYGNAYDNKGGGVYSLYSNIVAKNCNFTHNSSLGGDAIYCKESSLTLENCTVTQNRKSNTIDCSYRSNVNIINNTIVDNKGRGIYIQYICDVNIKNNTIRGNQNGGICIKQSNAIIKNNVIANNSTAYEGGGILCDYYWNQLITDNTIAGNTATYGGGIACTRNIESSIANNIIFGNYACNGGGGVYSSSNNIELMNNRISYNVTDSVGGGIACSGGSAFIFYNSILENKASKGGGLGFIEDATGKIVNNSIYNNYSILGGGVYGKGSIIAIEKNLILNNGADEKGGAIAFLNNSQNQKVQRNKISYNESGNGSVIYSLGSKSIIENNIINDNLSTNSGTIHCTFSEVRIVNNTITENFANESGGAIFAGDSSEINVFNTILWNDSASIGSEIYLADSSIGVNAIIVTSSDIDSEDCYAGEGSEIVWMEGNINVLPQFSDTLYNLLESSPCIDAGNLFAITISGDTITAPMIDYTGKPRPLLSNWDIGACEYSSDTLHTVCGIVCGVWEALHSPIYVGCDIFIPLDSTLVIEPGCSVIFLGHFKFEIENNALLKAIGTESDSIVFSAIDTNFSDTSGGFYGLRFINAALGCSLSYCKIEYGHAIGEEEEDRKGGAIYCDSSTIVIENCNITKSHADEGGSGMYIYNSNAIISENKVSNNFSGSAVYCYKSQCNVINNEIENNQNGNGILLYYTYSSINNNFINLNEGCGIYCDGNGEVYISDNIIMNNCTDGHGGGVLIAGSTKPIISNNVITYNVSGNCGGGIYYGGDPGYYIINNMISNNTALYGGGIGAKYNRKPFIINNTIVNNNASKGGGLYFFYDCKPIIFNTILWGNIADEGNDIFAEGWYYDDYEEYYYDRPCYVSVAYTNIDSLECEVQNESIVLWEEGNILVDPLFLSHSDFHLQPGSPCIDSGMDSVSINNPAWDTVLYAPSQDFEGDYRPFDLSWDIGADEYNPSYFIDSTPPCIIWIYPIEGMVNVPIDTSGKINICGLCSAVYETEVDSSSIMTWVTSVTNPDYSKYLDFTVTPNSCLGYEISFDFDDSAYVDLPYNSEIEMCVQANDMTGNAVLECISFSTDKYYSYVCGNVSGCWTKELSPYCVTCNIIIPTDSTLIIYPGVEVIFTGYYEFFVDSNAVLKAVGNETDSIIFTVIESLFHGESYGHRGLRFYKSAESCELAYCRIEYGNADDFDDSDPDQSNGGGIFCLTTDLSIINCLIRYNTARDYGGGIYFRDSDPVVEKNKITQNAAPAGGGLYFHLSNPIINGNTISQNSSDYGGGFCFNYSNASLQSNYITHNSALESGGGILEFKSDVEGVNNILSNNASDIGGAMYLETQSRFISINNTIGLNSASSHGIGIYCRNKSRVTLFNTILWENPTGVEEAIYISYYNATSPCSVLIAYSDLEMTYCYIEPGAGEITFGSGIISDNPAFIDTFLQLPETSPCIDAGVEYLYIHKSGEIIWAPLIDFYGTQRPVSLKWDIGAFEFGVNLSTPEYELDIHTFPNPFNTFVNIVIKAFGNTVLYDNTQIQVFNINGRKIADLSEHLSLNLNYVKEQYNRDELGNRTSTISWHPQNIPSGIYLIRVIYEDQYALKKILYLK